jgi:hypothetical protein
MAFRLDPGRFTPAHVATLTDDGLRSLLALLDRIVKAEAVVPTSPELRALIDAARNEQARRAWDAVDRHAAEMLATLTAA